MFIEEKAIKTMLHKNLRRGPALACVTIDKESRCTAGRG